jgi:hypothetical protein
MSSSTGPITDEMAQGQETPPEPGFRGEPTRGLRTPDPLLTMTSRAFAAVCGRSGVSR